MSENEQGLRLALKRQHSSLHTAYHRVKDVEIELAKSNAAGVEQRDSLINAALNALQQLRLRLGAMHALKPDATKPVEDVLVVKKLQQSASAGILPASPVRTMAPRMDGFMERVADVVGFPPVSTAGYMSAAGYHPPAPQPVMPPVSHYWNQAVSRPAGDVSSGGRYELSPLSAAPSLPQTGSHMMGGGKAGPWLRVPQPAGGLSGTRSNDDLLSPIKPPTRSSLLYGSSPGSGTVNII